jgi:hypothetical protein
MAEHFTDNWVWYALIWLAFLAGFAACALFAGTRRDDDR